MVATVVCTLQFNKSTQGIASTNAVFEVMPAADWTSKMFVINLSDARGSTRRNWLESVAARTGIQIVYVDAVDKETLDYDRLHLLGADLRERAGHWDLTVGEIALSMSHQKIYQKMLDENIPVALIAEDDVDPCEDFLRRLAQTAAMLKNIEFDVVKLEYCVEDLAKPDDAIELREGGGGACTACYVVSNNGARILRDANTPVWMNADGIMHPHHLATVNQHLRQFHISPPVARQSLDLWGDAGSHHND